MDGTVLSNILAIGLVSTLHCSAMCGGIMGALSLSLPAEARERSGLFAVYVLLFNLGRLVTYAGLGAAVGVLGRGLLGVLPPQWAHWLFQGSLALVCVVVGLHLIGALPRLARFESLGALVWRLVEPLGRSLLPVTRPVQALAYGVVWGFLPCGLVYGMLLVALSAGGAQAGAAVMGVFWLGSLPTLLAAGMLTRAMVRLVRLPRLRFGLGLGLIALGFFTVLAPPFLPNPGVPMMAG